MNVTYYAIEIDYTCIAIYCIIGFYILKNIDKRKWILFCIDFLLILLVFSDVVMRKTLDDTCYFVTLDINCNSLLPYTLFCYSLKTILSVMVPFVICIFSYFVVSSSNLRYIKFVVISLPFLYICYDVIRIPVNGYVLMIAYNDGVIRNVFYVDSLLATLFYCGIGIMNTVRIINANKEILKEITYYRIEFLFMCIICIAPFLIAPLSLMFFGPLMPVAFAVTFVFLMTLSQHLRICVDALTSTNNLNELRRNLDNLLQLSEKERRNAFLIFIDVNNFKSINDNFGHYEGDVVLIQIARLLRRVALEFNCFLCRYGGDEFIIIKKNANVEKAASICKFIDSQLLRLKELTLVPYELSVSTGFVRFDKRFSSTQEFIDAADKLMYETKRSSKKDFSQFVKMSKSMKKTEAVH